MWRNTALGAGQRGKRAGVVLAVLLWGIAPFAQAQHPAAASAEDREARALFQAGHVAYDAGRYEAALEDFTQAYELSHRPALLFNIGSAADRLRRDEAALDSYRRYLAEVPNAENRVYVEGRIRLLSSHRIDARGAAADTVASAPEGLPSQEDRASNDVAEQWWFWTLIGVAVVGVGAGVTAAVLIDQANRGGDPSVESDFNGGGVVIALGSF